MTAKTWVLGLILILISTDNATASCNQENFQTPLRDALSQHAEYYRNQDWVGVVSTMPPKIFSRMAKQSGFRVFELEEAVAQNLQRKLGSERQRSIQYSYELHLNEDSLVQTETGRCYAAGNSVISYKSKVETRPVIAIGENHRWYFATIAKPESIEFIRSAYPDLPKLDLKEPTSVNREQ